MTRLLRDCIACAALFLALTPAALAEGPGVVPPAAHPYGHTYSDWAARWWQWALAQPLSTNPVLDTTGANCAAGQSGRVWFLAGTFSAGTVSRSCTVPAGTALLFPVLNNAYFAF